MSKYRVIQWYDRIGIWYQAQKKMFGLFWADIGHMRTEKDAAMKDLETHKNKVVYEE